MRGRIGGTIGVFLGAVVLAAAILGFFFVHAYQIPTSAMEPTLHCAKPGPDCQATHNDRVLTSSLLYRFRSPKRGEIVVFRTPPAAEVQCGEGGTFVKRLIGLPGESVKEDSNGNIWIRPRTGDRAFRELKEPYVKPDVRALDAEEHVAYHDHVWNVPKGQYFFLGDNRPDSCDSRAWGSVPRNDLIGKVFLVYWPLSRFGFR